MNLEAKKQYAIEFFRHMGSGETRPKALAMMAPAASWWIPGIGTWDKQQLADGMGAADRLFVGGVEAQILGVTAEGDRVAVESTSRAEVINGTQYNNRYHCLVLFKDDMIQEVREYCDTKYVADVLGPLMAEG